MKILDLCKSHYYNTASYVVALWAEEQGNCNESSSCDMPYNEM